MLCENNVDSGFAACKQCNKLLAFGSDEIDVASGETRSVCLIMTHRSGHRNQMNRIGKGQKTRRF